MADLPPASTLPFRPLMSRRVIRWVFAVAMVGGGLVLGALGSTVLMTLAERRPAIQILHQADAGGVAQNDGRILVYSAINRERSCNTETSHWLFTIVNRDGRDVRAYIPIAEDGPVPVQGMGETNYILSVPLPPGLWPAKWYWLESRTDFCGVFGWLLPIYSESTPLQIDIELNRAIVNVPVTTEHDGKTIVRSRSPVLPLTVKQP